MINYLHNPVFNALCTGDKHLGFGNDKVRCFDEAVSPFVGFDENYANGFAKLHELLPSGRKILYAIPSLITAPQGWQLQHEIKGLQFIYQGKKKLGSLTSDIVSLEKRHVPQMIALAKLTKPGPFDERTIEFGFYHGIFEEEQLIAMTGQRMHPGNYTEISAVCTHPDHLGKGYAHKLLLHQLDIILQHGQQPFLHVRDDNSRAISIYQQLGFVISRPMNFYFMKKE